MFKQESVALVDEYFESFVAEMLVDRFAREQMKVAHGFGVEVAVCVNTHTEVVVCYLRHSIIVSLVQDFFHRFSHHKPRAILLFGTSYVALVVAGAASLFVLGFKRTSSAVLFVSHS